MDQLPPTTPLRTWVEVSRSALLHNLSLVAKYARHAPIGVVIKANAYGHGIREATAIFDPEPNVAYLMVGSAEEGLALRASGCRKPILSLSYVDTHTAEALAAGIILTVADKEMLAQVGREAARTHITAQVHLKLETGMYRLGIGHDEIASILQLLTTLPHVRCTGLYTHLSDTNNDDTAYTEQQLATFYTFAQMIDPEHKLVWHTSASGSLYLPHTHDMVRVGTMLYGSWKSKRHKERLQKHFGADDLIPALSWKTRIIHCKRVPAGGALGYDCTYRAKHEMRIAIVPVGYADGYQRVLSNKGAVLIQGSYAPVVGIISMNLMTVDITHIPTACAGDEVILIGPYEKITPYAIAQELGSNPNAITGVINPLIPRYIV